MQRLINDRAPRQAPADLLRRLREIDDRAELVLVGKDRWLLGAVRATPERRRIGAALAARERAKTHPNVALLYLAELAGQGFAPIAAYNLRDPDGRIVADFQRRDRAYREHADATFERHLDEADSRHGTAETTRKLLDAAEVVSRDAVIWRGRRTPHTPRG